MASASSSAGASLPHDVLPCPTRSGARRCSFVIFTVLALVAVLPLVGLFFFRLYDNQLIRQTQAELIAQSRVLAAIYARDVQAQPRQWHPARHRSSTRGAFRSEAIR